MASQAVLLHVGYPKTGSTWLRHTLYENPARGFASPWERNDLHRVFLKPHPLAFDRDQARRFLDAGIEQARSSGLVPVVANEMFTGNTHVGSWNSTVMADRLAAVVPEARVVLVIREQRSMILSSYSEFVKSGGQGSIDRYVTPPRGGVGVPAFDFMQFEYDRLITYYERLFPGRVLVLAFEQLRRDPTAFAARIASFAGAPEQGAIEDDAQNPSLSPLSLAVKQRLNLLFRHAVNPAGLMDDPPRNWRLVRRLTRLDRRLPAGLRRSGRARLERRVSDLIGDRYLDSNARTAELTGLDLAAFGYAVRPAVRPVARTS